ncbi:HAMP domain-containing histidine kinase [Lactobacillus rodentium]|uniref:histidine kinase n=1 Tax=Lactobacillus rodentium TaxID=947835 RepID=A0A2Z6T7F0_9LACO|nr:HAMP domain-containing sensor histidine kinase [Lactobacillus rodentium]MCR1894037.1 HAMP domain-containing histidine kinase [Lactobacillus rodentium]GBG04098.1 two-component system sensor histidine kinase [Lactobacillus rodentium]
MKKQKVKLTGREKSELFGEALVTIVLLLLLNLSIVILLNLAVMNDPHLENNIFFLKKNITLWNGSHLWSWQRGFIVILIIFDVIILWWRLIRRYHQMQLRHVIDELHYIADGHLDHRIPFTVKTDLQKVIDSINALVESTVAAMEEERQIEKSKDDLITNVSHDIRTPLTSIIGYLGLLKYQNDLSQDNKKYISIAYDKSLQMKALADDLFEYTTLKSSNKSKLVLAPLHINSMLEQVAAGFELEAENKNIEFNVETRPHDLTIEADAKKLVRVLNNLISNALKYGNGASRINLIANKVNNQYVELRVENNGEKIPEAALKSIFERFYRVESSRNLQTGGAGLGLAISQNIVELHGGTITCKSDDSWTSFIIRLPLNSPQE